MGEKGEDNMNLSGGKCLTGPMKCFILMSMLLYIISPVDLLPEMFLGPIGLIDDLAVGIGAWNIMKGGDILGGLKQAKNIKTKR